MDKRIVLVLASVVTVYGVAGCSRTRVEEPKYILVPAGKGGASGARAGGTCPAWTDPRAFATLKSDASRSFEAALALLHDREKFCVRDTDSSMPLIFSLAAESERIARKILASPSLYTTRLPQGDGPTLAHVIAQHHEGLALELLRRRDIATLKDNKGLSVAAYGALKWERVALAELRDPRYHTLTDGDGVSIAHLVARKWRSAALYIVSHPDRFQQRDRDSRLPVHYAAGAFPQAALELMKGGRAWQERDNEGITPVHLAALTCSIDVMRRIVEDARFAGLRDRQGRSPVHYAAMRCGDEAVARMLLSSKRIALLPDGGGYTVAHYMVHHRHGAEMVLEDSSILFATTSGKGTWWSVAHELGGCTPYGPSMLLTRALEAPQPFMKYDRGAAAPVSPLHAALDPVKNRACLGRPSHAGKGWAERRLSDVRKGAEILAHGVEGALARASSASPSPSSSHGKAGRRRGGQKRNRSKKNESRERKARPLPSGIWLLSDAEGRTLFHLAAYLSPTIASLMTLRNVGWDLRDGRGRTPLHYAASRQEKVALYVVHHPFFARLGDGAGVPVVHIAVASFESAAMEALKLRDVWSVTDSRGVTAAHVAVASFPKAGRWVLTQKTPPIYRTYFGASLKVRGQAVAHWAVRFPSVAEMAVRDAKVCSLRDGAGLSVAHWVVLMHPTIDPSKFSPACVDLKTPWGKSVRDMMKR